MKTAVAVLMTTLVASSMARAYDSIACGPPDERDDCEGLEAARTPWFRSEHAQIWLRSRQLAGLPAAVDDPFVLVTPTLGIAIEDEIGDEWASLLPAPLDLATTMEIRQTEIAVFAQLPDKSWSLWDWASGNEGCPPLGDDIVTGCHAFKAHMGWLNSNHFLPQAEQAFAYHHALAVERAQACAAMANLLDDSELSLVVIEACDREALVLEAIAHHYLQDAWSMGHMWQRWGSPDAADFPTIVTSADGLGAIKAVGDAVGRASGIIHGARAITGMPDAMCAPEDGVAFSYGDELFPGAGDLFLDDVNADITFFDQRELLYGCAATAMREVYAAGARSLGPLGTRTALDVDLADCFPQRATNRAMALGAAIQIASDVEGLFTEEQLALLQAMSTAWLNSLGLEGNPATMLYLPLTEQILSAVYFPLLDAGLIDRAVVTLWNEDMARIQDEIRFAAREAPDGIDLASGGLGPLLSMQPNGRYDGVGSYTDPALPWRPTAGDVSARVEDAGNILSRAFINAHADDWCAAFDEGTLETNLSELRTNVAATRGTDAEDAACAVCTYFAGLHLWPSEQGEHVIEQAPVCERLQNPSAATVELDDIVEVTSGREDIVVVASGDNSELWCGCGLPFIFYSRPGPSLCNTADDTESLVINLGFLSESGGFFVDTPDYEVVVSSADEVFETTLVQHGSGGASITGVRVGRGTTPLRLSIPELDFDIDFTVRADVDTCDHPCNAYYASLGPEGCRTPGRDRDLDPDCCCCT